MGLRRNKPGEQQPGRSLGESSVGESSDGSEALIYCSQCGRYQEPGYEYCADCGYHFAELSHVSGTGDSAFEPTAAAGPSSHVIRRGGGVTWGGWQIAAGVILVLLSLVAAAVVASYLASLYPEQEDAVATWIAVHLMAVSIVVIIWFLGLRRSRRPLAVLGLSRVRMPRKGTVLLMAGVLGASLIATSIYAGIVEWLGTDILVPPEVVSDITFDGTAMLLSFQALAFITPLSEEIFFRGFIFGGLLPRLGPWPAIVVSALIFSAFHFSLGVLIPIFMTGFLLGWLYWRTGSLWAAIGAHAGQNALALGVQVLSG